MSSHTQMPATAVTRSIVVEAPPEVAFEVFTGQFDRVKPRDHGILTVEIAESVFERHVGGRVYDRGVDGSECAWGRVLAYEPPHRVVFSWDLSPEFEIETDLDNTSEVEVRFLPEGETRTRVELQHRNLDRHGGEWRGLRDSVGGDGGWPLYLGRLADAARTAP